MTSLRFMSWNWNCFSDNRNDLKADLIERQNPRVHVVALQEVDRPAIRMLKERFEPWELVLPEGWDPEGVPSPDPGVALMLAPDVSVVQRLVPDLTAWRAVGAPAHDDYPLEVDGIDGDHPDSMPEHRYFVGARVAVGSEAIDVVSAWPPHSAGKGAAAERRVLGKRRSYAVLRAWLRSMDRIVLGIDANAWVDPGALKDPRLRWDPTKPRLLGEQQDDVGAFVHNGFLRSDLERNSEWPEDRELPRDAFRVWLSDDAPERKALVADLLKRRPYGPLATTFVRGSNHPYADRRDLVMISNGVRVTRVDHNYEDSVAAGSDHSYVLCDLEV